MSSEDVINFKKYISMDDYQCKWYFYDDDIRVPDEHIKNIKPLSKRYSIMMWEKYISKNNRHLMLLADSEWPVSMQKASYNWQNDWDENNYEGLKNYLSDKVSFHDDEIIFFFWMKEWAVETRWEIFINYWINFLFEDEGPILISPQRHEAISFGPNGTLLIGKRIDI